MDWTGIFLQFLESFLNVVGMWLVRHPDLLRKGSIRVGEFHKSLRRLDFMKTGYFYIPLKVHYGRRLLSLGVNVCV